MSPALVVDIGLALLALAIGLFAIGTRSTYSAAVGFVAYGLLIALIWVRLAAVDVALTEAAIGSGLTGLLFLTAAARLRGVESTLRAPSMSIRIAAAVLSVAVTAALAFAVLHLPTAPASLAAPAAANLASTGLGNPVTAVLMAFRATDTFLEKVALVLALVGVWSLARDTHWGGRPGLRHEADPKGTLTFLARVLPPIGLVIGVHVFWTGADHPGGAFPGGTIIAAMWLLAIMACLADTPAVSRRWLRAVLISGPALFLAVGLGGLAFGDAFLAYPVAYAKPIILGIEIAMTVTVAVTLGLLIAGAPERPAKPPTDPSPRDT